MDNFKGDGIRYSNEIMSISEVLDVFYVKVTTRYSSRGERLWLVMFAGFWILLCRQNARVGPYFALTQARTKIDQRCAK